MTDQGLAEDAKAVGFEARSFCILSRVVLDEAVPPARSRRQCQYNSRLWLLLLGHASLRRKYGWQKTFSICTGTLVGRAWGR